MKVTITKTHLLFIIILEMGHQTRNGQSSTLNPFSEDGLGPSWTPREEDYQV